MVIFHLKEGIYSVCVSGCVFMVCVCVCVQVQSLTIQMTLADPENKALCAEALAPVLHRNLFIQ